MKFFLDENVSVGCLKPLEALYGEHEFRHAYKEGLEAQRMCRCSGCSASKAMTRSSQKTGPNCETTKNAARSSTRVALIGYAAKGVKGLRGLATETATLTVGLVYVLADLRPEPHVYKLKGVGIQPAQHVAVSPVGLPGWEGPQARPGTRLSRS